MGKLHILLHNSLVVAFYAGLVRERRKKTFPLNRRTENINAASFSVWDFKIVVASFAALILFFPPPHLREPKVGHFQKYS